MLYRTLLKMSFLPPLLNILVVILGLLIMIRYRRLGIVLSLLGLLSLYGLSTPFVSNSLLSSIEIRDAVSLEELESIKHSDAAIVVLGAGHSAFREEYGGPWPDPNAIQRLNYAALLHQRTDLPLMTTGGNSGFSQTKHAQVMASYLEQMFELQTRWIESNSLTTKENAVFAAEILAAEDIDTVLLVTQSVHMRRSILLFEAQGLRVIAAPTELSHSRSSGIVDYLPSPVNLVTSYMVMHEQLGYFWYRLIGI